jgi:hypothetical protein
MLDPILHRAPLLSPDRTETTLLRGISRSGMRSSVPTAE